MAGTFGRINIDDLVYLAQFLQQIRHGQSQPGLPCSPPQQCPEQHRDSAIESMDLDFAVGPVTQRPPSPNAAVLHFVENLLDDKLAPVSSNHLRVGPFPMTGNEQRFAQIRVG